MTTLSFNDRYQKTAPASSTDPQSVDFEIFSIADLDVYVDGAETTDFTVAATFTDGVSSNAVVTIITPVVASPTVEIVGARDPRRDQFLVAAGAALVAAMNSDLARRTAEIMELFRDTGRAVKAPFGENLSKALPKAADRANKYLFFDSAGDAGATGDAPPTTTQDFDTRTALEAANIEAAINLIVTGGYSAYGDGGGATYKRVGSPPAHALKVKSADDTWWEFVFTGYVDIRQNGGVADGTTDDATAVQGVIDFVTQYDGAHVIFPPNTAVGTTIVVEDKNAIILETLRGASAGSLIASDSPSLKWIGSSGGTVLRIVDALRITLLNFDISGEDTADYGLRLEGNQSGWGVSNYLYCNFYGCNKNAMLKTIELGASSGDFGRNRFHRCRFRGNHAASATAKDDALVTYDQDDSVLDVYDQCEFIFKSGGSRVVGSYAMWFEAGTPRVIFNDCYTVAENGIFVKSSGPNPLLHIRNHYSEDDNFVSFANINTRQMLINCSHVTGGGVSVAYAGNSGGGEPLIIDGGKFAGSLSLTNGSAGVIMSNSPTFDGGVPALTEDEGMVLIGRSFGSGTVDTVAAINASAFVPFERDSQDASNVFANLRKGTIIPASLSANRVISNPTNVHATLDLGREIEYRLTNDGTAWVVTFASEFKLVGGAYTHSGISKTDIIAFRYDGTNWLEIRRSMDVS